MPRASWFGSWFGHRTASGSSGTTAQRDPWFGVWFGRRAAAGTAVTLTPQALSATGQLTSISSTGTARILPAPLVGAATIPPWLLHTSAALGVTALAAPGTISAATVALDSTLIVSPLVGIGGAIFTGVVFDGDYLFIARLHAPAALTDPTVITDKGSFGTAYTGPLLVRWPLGTTPESDRAFWSQTHARGVATGKILAQFLDVRPHATDQPTALSLPQTINPLAFLLTNVIRGSAYLVRLQVGGIGSGALNPKYLSWLRKIVPPHVMLLFQLELTEPIDDYLPDDSGETPAPMVPAMLAQSDWSPDVYTEGDLITSRVTPDYYA